MCELELASGSGRLDLRPAFDGVQRFVEFALASQCRGIPVMPDPALHAFLFDAFEPLFGLKICLVGIRLLNA